MLKFVVLSVLAIGCASETLRGGENFGYGGYHGLGGHGLGGSGFRNVVMGGYGGSSGLVDKEGGLRGDSKFIGGAYGYGYGRGMIGGFGGIGERKFYGQGYGLGGGLTGGLGGLGYYYMPAGYQRFGGQMGGQQVYIMGGHIPQTYGVGMYHGGNVGMFGGRNIHHVEHSNIAVRPAVSFLTQHVSEPVQEVVQAAVTQLGRTVEYKNMPYQEQPMHAQVVEVEPSETPLHIHFKTKSSSVSLSQAHQQAPAQEAQIAQTQDEPARLIHEIQKPIIQEVREVITPYRQVTQEIQPVVEAVHTVVTKAEGQRQQYVANTQYQPTTYTANMGVEHRQIVTAQPTTFVAKQAVVQPIATTTAVVEPVSTVVTGVQPVVYGYGAGISQPVGGSYGSYSYGSGIAQPVVGGSYGSYGYGSGITGGVSSSIIPVQTQTFNYEPSTMVSSGLTGYESIGQPISTSSSVITTGRPLTTSFGVSGVTGSSSSVRSEGSEIRGY